MDSFKVTVYIDVIDDEPDEQWVALERIKYIFDEALSNTIFINKDETKIINGFSSLGVKVSTLPSEPYDQAIAIPIFYKLNAICEGKFNITNMMFKSHLSDQVEFIFDADMTSIYDEKNGWWKQSNTSVADKINKKDKIVKLEKDCDWHEIGLEWKGKERKPATIIFTMDTEKP